MTKYIIAIAVLALWAVVMRRLAIRRDNNTKIYQNEHKRSSRDSRGI